jgi:outer membrane protein assembly factor BamB
MSSVLAVPTDKSAHDVPDLLKRSDGDDMRIWWIAVAAVLAPGVTTGGGPASAAAGGAWPQAGFGATNSAYNPAESVLNASSARRLKARWSVTPAARDTSCVRRTPPVVSGGRVFIPDADGVSAFAVGTGKRLWTAPKAFDEGAGPLLAVSGTTLVGTANFCFSASDSNGAMVALNAATGAEIWSVGRDTPYTSMVIDGGLVIASGPELAADSAAVTAYRLADGTVKWQRTGVSAANAVAAGGVMLLAKADGTGSIAVDVATGAVRWTSGKEWAVQSADPSGVRTYATDPSGTLVSLRSSTGVVGWSAPGGGVTTDGRQVFVTRGTTLICYDAGTGRRKWAKALGGTVGRPIRAGGLVYAAVAGKPLVILNAATGTVAAKSTVKAVGNVVVTGGRLYVDDGTKLRTYTP